MFTNISYNGCRMKHLFLFLTMFTGVAGMLRGQNIEYFRSVLTSNDTEAKRTVLLQIRSLHNEDASRAAVIALRDRNEIVRATAASSILFLPRTEAVSVLLPLLSDKKPFVRTEATYALGAVGDVSAVSSLIKTLQNDRSIESRSAAAIALGRIGDESSIDPLVSVLSKTRSENNEFLRRSAARSIGQLAEGAAYQGRKNPVNYFTAVFVLLDILNNRKEADDIRREAAAALGWIGNHAALPALRAKLNSVDNYLADNCRQAIARIEAQK
jgi:HEAT repeat protein